MHGADPSAIRDTFDLVASVVLCVPSFKNSIQSREKPNGFWKQCRLVCWYRFPFPGVGSGTVLPVPGAECGALIERESRFLGTVLPLVFSIVSLFQVSGVALCCLFLLLSMEH